MGEDTKEEAMERASAFLAELSELSMKYNVFIETSGSEDGHPVLIVDDGNGRTVAFVDLKWLDFFWHLTREAADGCKLKPKGYVSCLDDAEVNLN